MLYGILIATGTMVIGLVGFGIYLIISRKIISGRIVKAVLGGSLIISVGIMIFLTISLIIAPSSIAFAQQVEPHTNETPSEIHETAPLDPNAGMGFLAAAIAVGLGSIGAAIAVGMSTAAAMGAISENPSVFGKSILYVGMAEGVAIYGLIVAILILGRL